MPHISETRISIVAGGIEQRAAIRTPYWYRGQVLDIEMDGQSYHLGSASGAGCNCLIDTLRQVVPGAIMCSVAAVRSALEDRHRGLPTEIIPGDYLPLDFLDIVDLFGFYNELGRIRASWAHRFRVVCVSI